MSSPQSSTIPQILLLNDDEQVLNPSVFELTSISWSVSPVAVCEPDPGDIEPFPSYDEPDDVVSDSAFVVFAN
ncbi:hypothetical protein IAR50_002187 [Cryptococcus sp. DSM 104548]